MNPKPFEYSKESEHLTVDAKKLAEVIRIHQSMRRELDEVARAFERVAATSALCCIEPSPARGAGSMQAASEADDAGTPPPTTTSA